ncbi:MAG: NAD-dependent protein deacetylase [Clostridia bacterium]|nr:NAD-dependent protein deacetylase [Deltaproteobacteria bacterium]
MFAELVDLLRGRRTLVLTGAGCSTESGIPDYRGPTGAMRARQPMKYQEFIGSALGRQRYWARSAVGWLRFKAAAPNAGHFALAELEARGAVRGLITQNVDALHERAGSKRVIELHGSLHRVRCLHCGLLEDRESVQQRIAFENRGVLPASIAELQYAPDGDVSLSDETVAQFTAPSCRSCGGALKPDVIFFGENVPPHTTQDAWSLLAEADALLVVGSSLAVFSGYRFVKAAHERGVPVAIVNRGVTRGDPQATLRVDGAAGAVLTELLSALTTVAAAG